MINRKFVLWFLNFVCFGESAVKIWKHDVDIFNPEHWEGGKAGDQCEGLDLRDARHSFLVIDQLDVKQVLLPSDITIFLPEGTHITLHEGTTTDMDCVRMKNDFDAHGWLDPSSWKVEGAESNVAIPHLERVPCRYDDVDFPKGWKSAGCWLDDLLLDDSSNRLNLHAFKFGDEYMTNEDLVDLQDSPMDLFSHKLHKLIEIDWQPCNDPSGCACGNSLQDGVCTYVEEPQRYDCLEPIIPIGFCTKMCGASILINSDELSRNFELERIRKALGDYSSDTHVSKVKNESDTLIQIIFAEKEFDGTSLDDAKDFYSVLLTDNSFGVVSATLLSSGFRIFGGNTGKTVVSIVFGTLCGVLLVFGIIFFVNSPQFARLDLRNRYHFSPRRLSTLLAKYEKMEDETLAFQKSESVLGLEKSFDNPMYGSEAPSTSSASTAKVSEKKIDPKSEIYMENPMYEISSLVDDENIIEESQLVDLTPPKKSSEE